MKTLNADLFKGPEEYKKFLQVMEETIKDAHGNMIPVIYNGKTLGYLVGPDSPYFDKRLIDKKCYFQVSADDKVVAIYDTSTQAIEHARICVQDAKKVTIEPVRMTSDEFLDATDKLING